MNGLTIVSKEPQWPVINLYLSDPSINSDEAAAMLRAYDEACGLLELSGRKFSTRVIATLIDNFAYDGERDASRLVEGVLAVLAPRDC